jgi:hypothetical protein
MSENIYQFNGTLLVSVPDGALNTSAAPIAFPGRGYTSYGAPVLQNTLWTMQNFAGTVAPTPLLQGVEWYNSNTDELQVYTGSTWSVLFKDNQTNMPAANNSYDLGSSTMKFANVYATTFNGTATQALYADVAERYAADAVLEVGDVVRLGGEAEITLTTVDCDTDVFGVISDKPAYKMNSDAGTDKTHPYVALLGRTPCKVVGRTAKGDRLVASSIPGVARAADGGEDPHSIVGRALAAKETEEVGLVEIVIGRS